MTTIVELERTLRQASHAYYSGAEATLSDQEFDLLRDELEELDPGNAFLSEVGAPVTNSLTKVRHRMPMGSLKKITTEAEFQTWVGSLLPKGKKTKTTFHDPKISVSLKLDGLSIELIYEKGKFVQAITRGDGEEGEDVTHTIKNAKFFPRTISVMDRVSVRCEAMLQIADWKEHFADKANPRNAASGLVRRTDAKGSEHLVCIAFDVLFNGGFRTEHERIEWLIKEKFSTTPNQVVSASKVMQAIKWIEDQRDQLDYEIDGAVLKANDIDLQKELGEHNDRRPRWARAWKFAAMGGHSTLEGITWSVGTRGTITPVANIAPVKVGGTTIRNVSLHNVNEIDRLDLGIGDEIEVIRAGDVIPFIVRVINKEYICPLCGYKGDINAQKRFHESKSK